MSGQSTERGAFASNLGFILAAAGSAVGLGNIWKFPYITGVYGGGAFVLVYLGCILLVGLPLMYAELVIGNRSGLSAVGAFKKLTAHAPRSRVLSALAGGLAVLSGFLILSFYSVVAGWAIHFLFVSMGLIAGKGASEATFTAVAHSGAWSSLWHTVFMIGTAGVVAAGVHRGIEAACKVLMPLLFGIVLLLLAYVILETDGVGASARFLFAPDFSKLSGEAVLEALGHSFFTLSLGMGAMVTYGSYLSEDRAIVRDGVAVAVLDTVLALAAGLVIFAVVFAQGKEPAAGPGLVFVTLPDLFATMPFGAAVASAFFFMLVFAAWSSAISLLEVVAAWLVDSLGVPRVKATLGASVAIWAIGLLCAYGVGAPGMGESFFDLFDNLTTKYTLPVGGLLVALIAGWVLLPNDREAGFRAFKLPFFATFWLWTIRIVTPLLVSLVILHGLGVIG